ncbi:hypothetical protein HPB50_005993 [Hyalomma asiaticum]|uniref:Uncharacterized protein n=1 Tax=Hyalomma asiaticum TaxID=266040 RepID=A0ACB7S9L4_HYAAI|nr:hypothetical protein HPB50_005993 [Hyalomma asiaticum]
MVYIVRSLRPLELSASTNECVRLPCRRPVAARLSKAELPAVKAAGVQVASQSLDNTSSRPSLVRKPRDSRRSLAYDSAEASVAEKHHGRAHVGLTCGTSFTTRETPLCCGIPDVSPH